METGLRQRRLAALQENDLAKSYGQLQAQIQKLQAEAEALKAKEIEGVIARIRTAIEHYGITPDQLFGKAKKASTGRAAAKKAPARKSAAKGKPVAIKYRDGDNTWTGRGNKPRWLVARLEEGKQLAQHEFRLLLGDEMAAVGHDERVHVLCDPLERFAALGPAPAAVRIADATAHR